MKRIDCIWVLALAGTVMACNSGSPILGCEIDVQTGLCVGRNVPGPGPGPGPGTGGTGGTGVTEGFTNANTCTNNTEPGCIAPDTCNCDYGCVALLNTFGFTAILNVIPDEAFVGGGEFDVEFDGQFIVSESFIEGAEGVVGDISEITVLEGAVLPVTALEGATGPDTIVTLPGGLVLDLTLDPDGNGIDGPFPIPFVRTTGTYTFDASGDTACFNLSTGTATPPMTDLKFVLDITKPPGLFAVPFECQPANQEAINQTNVPCPNGDSDCDFGLCDNVPGDESCNGVLIPEADAGQVCFDIP